MTNLERRIAEALCLAAACTAESMLPDSGVSPGAAKALARAHRIRAVRLSAMLTGVA